MQFALPALIIGTTLKAGSDLMAAREQTRAAAFEEQQLKIQADQAKTAADQIEAQRRQELDAQLGTIAAIRGARGVGSDSPTGAAIMDAVTSEKEQQGRTERLNYLLKSDQARIGSEFARDRKNMAPIAGLMRAGSDVAEGMFKYSRLKYA